VIRTARFAAFTAGLSLGCAAAPPAPRPAAPDAVPSIDGALQGRLREAALAPWRDVPDSYPPREPALPEPPPPPPAHGLPPPVIQATVRSGFPRLRGCYEDALRKKPDLTIKVTTRFTIRADGSVADVKVTSDVPEDALTACVAQRFATLSFPRPASGVVTVTYPIQFSQAEDDSPPSQPPPPAAPPARAPSTPPRYLDPPSPATEEPWPILAIEGGLLLLDGAPLATPDLSALAKPAKLDPLLDALRARRAAHRVKHAGSRFAGVIGLRAAAATPIAAFKSVFHTAALAGYPTSLWQVADDPGQIFALEAQVALSPREAAAAPVEPERVLDARVEANGITLTWRRGAGDVASTQADDPTVGVHLCAGYQRYAEHTAVEDGKPNLLVLRAAPGLVAGSLRATLRAVEACRREVPLAPRRTAMIPAFRVIFSVR
jgi:hypothetical protein